MSDCYSEAAVRHYIDGGILFQNTRYDNAMCHYAFSAECAIKALWEQFRVVYPQLPLDKIHSVEADLVSMITYCELLGLWDPRLSLILGLDSLPPVLFEKHPGRRYQNDINFTDAEVISSEKFAAQLNRQIISAAIDGRLSYKTERGIL